MKKEKTILTLGLACLFSCSSSIPVKSIEITNKEDDSLYYLYRNGDINEDASSLSETSRTIDSANALNLIESKEPFILYFYQTSCKHCQDIKDSLIYFLKETKLCLYAVSNSSISPFCNAINSSYPSLGLDSSKIGTPYCCIVEGSTSTILDMSNNAYSPYVFSEYLSPKINLTNLYTFRNASSFASFMEENQAALGYVSNSLNSLRGAMLEKAKRASTPLAIFEGDKASSDELAALKEKGYQEDTLVYLGKAYDSSSNEAARIIESFS